MGCLRLVLVRTRTGVAFVAGINRVGQPHRGPTTITYRTLGSLTDGYETEWGHSPLTPSRTEGHGYCLYIEVPDPDFRPMALPFSVLADAFAEMQKRLSNP